MTTASLSPAEHSREVVRATLPLMSKHAGDFLPVSYAVWFRYAEGANEALRKEVDSAISKMGRLSSDVSVELYKRHIVEGVEQVVQRAQDEVLAVMDRAGATMRTMSAETEKFDLDLSDFDRVLAASEGQEGLRDEVAGMRSNAQRMTETLREVQAQLQASQSEVDALRNDLERSHQEANTDALSGLTNRRGFDQLVRTLCEQHTASAEPLCLLMLDIDHFKRINDTYGHPLGDQVIRAVGQTIRAIVKGQDVAARYGGEEFAVLLPATKLEDAMTVAEKIRLAIERTTIRQSEGAEPVANLSISIGVAQFGTMEPAAAFITRADRALYRSKTLGRNRVTAAG